MVAHNGAAHSTAPSSSDCPDAERSTSNSVAFSDAAEKLSLYLRMTDALANAGMESARASQGEYASWRRNIVDCDEQRRVAPRHCPQIGQPMSRMLTIPSEEKQIRLFLPGTSHAKSGQTLRSLGLWREAAAGWSNARPAAQVERLAWILPRRVRCEPGNSVS